MEVEEVWDDSGPSRYGYNDPGEVAHEMVEQALEPFWAGMKRHQERGMETDAMRLCIGILEGIEQYRSESASEFKDWADDSPETLFYATLDRWIKGCKAPKKSLQEMKAYLADSYAELEAKVTSHFNRACR